MPTDPHAALATTWRPLGAYSAWAAALLVCALFLGAPHAEAACGDGVLDGGEMCDDGNLADGDCCTAACQRPGTCIATDKSTIVYRDLGDDRLDRIFWKYRRGPTSFEDFGDPTEETSYSFCMWDDDELVIDARVQSGGFCFPMRPCWQIRGRVEATGYKYFNKPANDDGLQRIYIAKINPPVNATISVRADGTEIDPRGPIGFDQYFNQTEADAGCSSDAPRCAGLLGGDLRRPQAQRLQALQGIPDTRQSSEALP